MTPNFSTTEPTPGEYMPCPDCGSRSICQDCIDRIDELAWIVGMARQADFLEADDDC